MHRDVRYFRYVLQTTVYVSFESGAEHVGRVILRRLGRLTPLVPLGSASTARIGYYALSHIRTSRQNDSLHVDC